MNTMPVPEPEAGPSGIKLQAGLNGSENKEDSSEAAGSSSESLGVEQLRDKLETVMNKAVNVTLFSFGDQCKSN